jgi:hypothetical protein
LEAPIKYQICVTNAIVTRTVFSDTPAPCFLLAITALNPSIELFFRPVLAEQFGDIGDFHGKAREGSGGGKMLLNTISVVGSVTIE